MTRPICVHTRKDAPTEQLLSRLERAFQTVALGLSLESPWGSSPGPHRLHWYLTAEPLRVDTKVAPSRGFDRAHSFCVGGEEQDGAALRCVAGALIAEWTPATATWLREGFARRVASRLGTASRPFPAPPPWAEAQSHPEEGVLLPAEDGRAALFFEYLEQFSPHRAPLSGPLAALLVTATQTQAGALRHDAEPDLLDTLRVNLDGDRDRFARLMDDFAVFRWVRGGEEHARPRLAWEVAQASLPRTLVLPEPLLPGGTGYLRVSLEPSGEAPSGYLALRTYCEEPVSYVWSFLVLGPNDRVDRHVPVPFHEQLSHAQARIGQLEGARSVVAVGTNLGGVDLAHPFDPDHGPHEAHGCRVTFNWLPAADDER